MRFLMKINEISRDCPPKAGISGLRCFRVPDMTGREAADRPARGECYLKKRSRSLLKGVKRFCSEAGTRVQVSVFPKRPAPSIVALMFSRLLSSDSDALA